MKNESNLLRSELPGVLLVVRCIAACRPCIALHVHRLLLQWICVQCTVAVRGLFTKLHVRKPDIRKFNVSEHVAHSDLILAHNKYCSETFVKHVSIPGAEIADKKKMFFQFLHTEDITQIVI